MRQFPSASVVLLMLFGGACLAERWLAIRAARLHPARKVPIEHWENEGGALSPPPFSGIATSQVPR
jgi:hypothetical protein